MLSTGSGSASTRMRSATASRSCWAASRSTIRAGLVGHSDGDVIAHALKDALPARLGDIGHSSLGRRSSTRSRCSRMRTGVQRRPGLSRLRAQREPGSARETVRSRRGAMVEFALALALMPTPRRGATRSRRRHRPPSRPRRPLRGDVIAHALTDALLGAARLTSARSFPRRRALPRRGLAPAAR